MALFGHTNIEVYSVLNRDHSLKKRRNPYHGVKCILILSYPNKLYMGPNRLMWHAQ
jgi:hypothetical protein